MTRCSALTRPSVVLFTCIFSCLLCLPVSAQSSHGNDPPSLRDGAWALQFQVSETFRLSSFQGSAISAKKHLSPRKALRFGIRFDAFIAEEKGDNRQPARDHNRLNITLTSQYVTYTAPRNKVSFFAGAGPLVKFGRDKREANTPGGLQADTQTNIGAGVSGVLGVEWFALDAISLTAEYAPQLTFDRLSTEVVLEGEVMDVVLQDVERTGFNLTSSLVRFGVSVYF